MASNESNISNKRILILVNHDVVIYNFRLELVERLLTDGYEVHISSPIGEHTDDLKKLGTHFHQVSFDRHGMNPIDELKLLHYYKKLIKTIQPLIVFTYTVKCNVYGGMAARALKIPFCANITGLGVTINNGGLRERLVLELYKRGLKKSQRVFFQNVANKEYFVQKNIINSPYTVLPGSGVNLNRHCFEPYPSEENGLILTYFGRIMKDKGIDELLDASRIITSKYPSVHFRVIGFFDDDYEKTIGQAANSGIIEYVEQQRDVHPWIAASHAIVMPSHHEGMSNVLLEAASAGRPVIASNIPGCKETFDDGISGIGFTVQDSEDLARAIEKFIGLSHEQKESMGKAGRKKMETEFSREIVVGKYLYEIRYVEK